MLKKTSFFVNILSNFSFLPSFFSLFCFSCFFLCCAFGELHAQNPSETEQERIIRLKREKTARDRQRVDSIRRLSDYEKALSLDTMRWIFKVAPLGLVDIFNPNIKIGAEYIYPFPSDAKFIKHLKLSRLTWSPEIGVGFPLGTSTTTRQSGRTLSILPLNYRTFWLNNELKVYREAFRPSFSSQLNGKERYHALEFQAFYRTFDVEGVDSVRNINGNFGISQLTFVLNFKRGVMYPYRGVYFDFYYGVGFRMINEFHNNPNNLKEQDDTHFSGFHRKGEASGTRVTLNISLGIKVLFFSFL